MCRSVCVPTQPLFGHNSYSFWACRPDPPNTPTLNAGAVETLCRSPACASKQQACCSTGKHHHQPRWVVVLLVIAQLRRQQLAQRPSLNQAHNAAHTSVAYCCCLFPHVNTFKPPTVLAGMPYPQNLQTALEVEEVVRQHGAVPATIAIIGGQPCIGG